LRILGEFAAALFAVVAVVLVTGPVSLSFPTGFGTTPPGLRGAPPTGVPGAVAPRSGTLTVVPAPAGTRSVCARADDANLYPQRTAGFLSFNGNLFDLPAGSAGRADLCYNATTGALSDRTEFSSLPGAVLHGVLGYPEAILGENLYGGLEGRANALLPLPGERERNLTSTNVWVSTRYSVSALDDSPYDFAFDDWLTQRPSTGASTGNEGNRVEIMIWLSNDLGMYLPQTAVRLGTFVNGSSVSGSWYQDHLCMGTNDVTFDYLFAPGGVAPGYGLREATLAVNLTAVLRNVASVLRTGACWAAPGTSIGSLYASAFPLGAEFYPTVGDTAGVNWRVSSLCYVLLPGSPPADGPSC
jgi:hypothetical protein